MPMKLEIKTPCGIILKPKETKPQKSNFELEAIVR